MALKINPRHEREIALNDLSADEFLALSAQTLKSLQWDLSKQSKTSLIAYTPMTGSSWSEEISIQITGPVAIFMSRCTGTQLVDWGKNKRNAEAFIEQFEKIRNEITPEQRQELTDAMINMPPDDKDGLSLQTGNEKSGFLSLFIPREGYFITPIIVLLNLLIFVLMLLSGVGILLPSVESLVQWGANFRPVTLDGGWWRLLTSCFIHIGILHLLLNMYALIYIGILLEPLLGRTRFLAAYIITGITASAASLWWNEMTVSAGASGAIFGMYGIFLSMLTTNLIEKSARKALMTSIGIFVVFNLMNGVQGGIDNAAHIGGLLSGCLIGYLLYPGLRNKSQNKRAVIAESFAIILPFIFCFWAYTHTTNDLAKYDAYMLEFQKLELEALSVFDLPEDASTETFIYELNEGGIATWHECEAVLAKMDALDIPAKLEEQNEKLRNYCDYRVNSFRLLTLAFQQNTAQYDDSIAYYNEQIEAVIASLSEE